MVNLVLTSYDKNSITFEDSIRNGIKNSVF